MYNAQIKYLKILPDITNLTTKTALNAVVNKTHSISNLVKTTD